MPSTKKIMLALTIFTMAAALPTPQLAGEGQAADSILTDTDNGVGHGIENAENNLAGLITSLKGTAATGNSGSSALPPTPHRRQLDKISNGAQNLANAAGIGSSTSAVTSALDGIDGTSTSGAANLGATVGSSEDSILEGAGNAVPRL